LQPACRAPAPSACINCIFCRNLLSCVSLPACSYWVLQENTSRKVGACRSLLTSSVIFNFYNPPRGSVPAVRLARHKFCNYNCAAAPLLQGRRYWTKGGDLRNFPVSRGCRKSKPRHLASAVATTNGRAHALASPAASSCSTTADGNADVSGSSAFEPRGGGAKARACTGVEADGTRALVVPHRRGCSATRRSCPRRSSRRRGLSQPSVALLCWQALQAGCGSSRLACLAHWASQVCPS
jgi:hypothetical protein